MKAWRKHIENAFNFFFCPKPLGFGLDRNELQSVCMPGIIVRSSWFTAPEWMLIHLHRSERRCKDVCIQHSCSIPAPITRSFLGGVINITHFPRCRERTHPFGEEFLSDYFTTFCWKTAFVLGVTPPTTMITTIK